MFSTIEWDTNLDDGDSLGTKRAGLFLKHAWGDVNFVKKI